jgi:hypothetical protein
VVQSETFVQTVEEPLVYITISKKVEVHHLYDEYEDGDFLKDGLRDIGETIGGGVALAFYSSCRNKPHRF